MLTDTLVGARGTAPVTPSRTIRDSLCLDRCQSRPITAPPSDTSMSFHKVQLGDGVEVTEPDAIFDARNTTPNALAGYLADRFAGRNWHWL
jgi:hypothetical protein